MASNRKIKVKKILVIRFSSIGDIVLTSPVVRCLHEQLGAEVHFLSKKRFASMLDHNPHISKRFYLEDSLSEVVSLLKKENYDAVIDLHHNLRTLRVKTALGKPNFSFPKLNLQKWLLVNMRINKLPKQHIVDRYFNAAEPLGVKNDGRGLDFFIPKKDEVDVGALGLRANEYVAFAIGGQFATKKMPEAKIIDLCKRINTKIVLLGGPEDAATAKHIVEQCANTINACGAFTLNQSASLVKQAKLMISHDTGLMHIAAAFQKKIVSVWGNTVPDFGMTPYYGSNPVEQLQAQVLGLSCRPCSKIGYQKCPKGHFRCMLDQDEQAIAEWVKSRS